MPLTNSVIRRYTPPTCTLEVLAQSSSLSRWMKQSVLKDLRFELSFNDPQLSEEQKTVIRGDRDQLEALCTAVTNYVQEFLQMSPENFWARFSHLEDSSKASNDSEPQQHKQSPVSTQPVNAFNTQIPETEIHIKPSNRLTHNLFLGSLGYQASTPIVKLSLLQLFDLATALDQYSADVLALPNLHQSRSRFATIPGWIPAVAVLAIAVGLIPFTWRLALDNSIESKKQQVAKKQTVTNEQTASETSPIQGLPSPTPPTRTDQLPSVAFGGPGLTVPGSNTPVPPSQTAPQTLPTPPTTATALSPGLLPSAPTSPQGEPFTTSSTPTSFPPYKPTTQPQFKIAPQPNNQQTTTAANSNKSGVFTESGKVSPNSSDPTISNLPSTLPVVPPIGSTAPNNLNSSALNQQSNSPTKNSVAAEDTSKLIQRLRQNRLTTTEVATNNSNTTLFDATTQVSEARQYLSKHWEPPSGLKQTLEYSLIVGVDGTLERILPLNKAARTHIERTGIPLIGEPFVSANPNGQSVIIRAVLSPDGKVQTFPEKD